MRPDRLSRIETVDGSLGRISRRATNVVALAATFLVAAGAVATATAAVSITNRDEADQKFTLIEGETRTDHVLKQNQVLKDVCPKGCVIRLNDSDDDEYQLEPTDIVSIEDGYLYYDEPEGAAGAKPEEKKPEEKKN